jgi:murein hydrolase activator
MRRPSLPRPGAHPARGRRLGTLVCLAALVGPGAVAAQQDTVQQQIRESQQRLQQIRAERDRLQRDMQTLEGRVRDMSSELSNIERQAAASAAALRELDYQTAALVASVEDITGQLVRSRDRLQERNVVLAQRLRVIYRQGPLHTVRVLLSAQSFADLLNRYKYLHLLSMQDRLLLEEISSLERELSFQEQSLQHSLAQIDHLRAEKLSEFAQLQQLEESRALSLRDARGQVSRAEQRIQQLASDERRLTGLIEDMERRRVEEERRRAAAGVTTDRGGLTTSQLGQLAWPLQGEILYRFGPERRPGGVTLRRNGIGIRAEPGTPVTAVSGGTVALARPMEGFGPGVVISHGAGYYSLYLYLGGIQVREGEDVLGGQVVGTVGAGPEEGSHLYLQIHAPVRGEAPTPIDPLPWLQSLR